MVPQMEGKVVEVTWITFLVTLTLGHALAQDSPVCPPPAPICRSYETSSCEFALNMIPVYVCRVDLGGILGIASALSYGSRPQVVYQQPYSPSSLYSSYATSQPQPLYAAYGRPPAQYRPSNTYVTSREAERDLPVAPLAVPQVSQGSAFPSRPQAQSGFSGSAREASSNPVQQTPNNSQGGGYGQRSGPYQGPQQSSNTISQPQPNTPTAYPGNAAMISEDQQNK